MTGNRQRLLQGEGYLIYKEGKFNYCKSKGHDSDACSYPGEKGAFVGKVISGGASRGCVFIGHNLVHVYMVLRLVTSVMNIQK